jgi:hypothetical protein
MLLPNWKCVFNSLILKQFHYIRSYYKHLILGITWACHSVQR